MKLKVRMPAPKRGIEEKEESEEFLAEETEEIKPPPPLGEYEITDDSARMYLQEIGRVPLLNIMKRSCYPGR